MSIRISRTRALRFTALAAASAMLAAAPSLGADRTENGLTLKVPATHKSLGEVYYVHPGKDAQATFTSDAPLEHIKGNSNHVVGYAIWDADVNELAAGEFRMPVDSLDTGIPLRNEHLQGERWLHAEEYPDVVFTLSGTRSASVERRTDQFTSYRITLLGEMTIRGESKKLEIPATVTLMDESDRTRSRFPGDLMAIRATYNIKLSDFGVQDQTIGAKVADEIEIDTVLFCSTVSPEDLRR